MGLCMVIRFLSLRFEERGGGNKQSELADEREIEGVGLRKELPELRRVEISDAELQVAHALAKLRALGDTAQAGADLFYNRSGRAARREDPVPGGNHQVDTCLPHGRDVGIMRYALRGSDRQDAHLPGLPHRLEWRK